MATEQVIVKESISQSNIGGIQDELLKMREKAYLCFEDVHGADCPECAKYI